MQFLESREIRNIYQKIKDIKFNKIFNKQTIRQNKNEKNLKFIEKNTINWYVKMMLINIFV